MIEEEYYMILAFSRIQKWTWFVFFLIAFGGCAGHNNTHYSSSVVQYLYPKKQDVVETPTVPVLSLPMKIGIAFVPSTSPYRGVYSLGTTLDETEKHDLMEKMAQNFKQYPFISSIEIIPSQYLIAGGGFDNLNQIRSMFGIDVIALISIDQIQYTDENFLSFSYWTLIGAYIVKGEIDDTNTLLDTAVYHIPSHKMLFRAPGTSQVKGSSTPINLSEQLRKDSREGFKLASNAMISNLQNELEHFKERVKKSPQEFQVVHKEGYTGGGNFGGFSLLIVLWLSAAALWGRFFDRS